MAQCNKAVGHGTGINGLILSLTQQSLASEASPWLVGTDKGGN